MKQLSLVLFYLTLSVNFAMAQVGPVMTFEKTEIDYGTVVLGGDGVRVFKFKNTGNQPLVIKKVRGSCGCTVPKWPTEAIQPGKSATIEVKYDTTRAGAYTKDVYVETNEAQPNHTLTIKINVVEKITTSSTTGSGSKR
jgi:predicted RecA/RadA family phage recombinase